MDQLNKQLSLGILPNELCFNKVNSGYDETKLLYNKRYQEFDFYGSKFPKEWQYEKLFHPVIKSISDNAKNNNVSPLKELQELKKISNNNINNVITNTSKLQICG